LKISIRTADETDKILIERHRRSIQVLSVMTLENCNGTSSHYNSSRVYTGEDLNPHPERVLVSNLHWYKMGRFLSDIRLPKNLKKCLNKHTLTLSRPS
jgi:hypothetical protein